MMNENKKIVAAITAVGHYVPEKILTNLELEKMVDTNDQWIRDSRWARMDQPGQ